MEYELADFPLRLPINALTSKIRDELEIESFPVIQKKEADQYKF